MKKSEKEQLMDRLQVSAFQAVYKQRSDLPKDERFVTAICLTNNNRFEEAIKKNPELVEKWLNEFGRKKNHARDRQARKRQELSG